MDWYVGRDSPGSDPAAEQGSTTEHSIVTPNGSSNPSSDPVMAEIVRRVQRLEDRLDARTLTVEVYNAREAAHTVEIAALAHRITTLEGAVSGATKLIIGAFLGIIIQFIVLAVTLFGRGVT